MEIYYPPLGVNPETRRPENVPRTPPYTPHRTKRGLERADSPASVSSSLHPAETESPAQKTAEQPEEDTVKVQELVEGEEGYFTDGDVVYPEETEEVDVVSDSELDTSCDDTDSETGISRRLSRLGCDNSPEAQFERFRREKHLRRRTNSRLWKRPHSETVKSDTEVTDLEAMPDHDLKESARRLRRRVRGPDKAEMQAEILFDDPSKSLPELGAESPGGAWRRGQSHNDNDGGNVNDDDDDDDDDDHDNDNNEDGENDEDESSNSRPRHGQI